MRQIPTPKELGYHMPAEWEPHAATWLAWPHARFHSYWGRRLSRVEDVFVQIISALQGETVKLMVVDAEMERQVKKKLDAAKVDKGHITFYCIPTIDVWTRDYGPIYVVNPADRKKGLGITHWVFNGWGKYPDLIHDTSVPALIHERTLQHHEYFHGGLVLEGGAIEVNGSGTVLTTESVLLNKNRNPYHTKAQIEEVLEQYFGVDHIVWLKKGLRHDDTDGHIDNLVRFVGHDTAVAAVEKDRRDVDYGTLKENFDTLRTVKLEDGTPLTVIPLPTPGRVVVDGERRAASYANFYIANKAVLVPVFGDKQRDDAAVGILREIFQTRNVRPINCLDLVASGGTVHCVTQQQPAPYSANAG